MPSLYLPTHPAPNAQRLGQAAGYPVGDSRTYFFKESVRVGSFSRMAEIDFSPGGFSRLLAAPPQGVMHLPDASGFSASQALTGEAFAHVLRYMHDGQTYTLAQYLARHPVMGLMVVQGGRRYLEAYQYERGPQHRFLGHSLAKTVMSMAFGLALHEERLPGLDVRADALAPALQGSLFGQASLRQLLHMGSGVCFEDRYDGLGDTARFSRLAAEQGVAAAAHSIQQREAADGARFSYSSAQSNVLSLVFQTAVGESLADYLSQRLWQRMGAQSDALWLHDRFGMVRASGSFCATLTDYARLATLLAHDGVRPDTGERVLPQSWLHDASDWTRHPPAFQPGKATNWPDGLGYGLHVWTFAGQPRRFALIGVYGQFIFVAPDLQLAMVQLSVGANAKNADTALVHEAHALWRGLLAHFQNQLGSDPN